MNGASAQQCPPLRLPAAASIGSALSQRRHFCLQQPLNNFSSVNMPGSPMAKSFNYTLGKMALLLFLFFSELATN